MIQEDASFQIVIPVFNEELILESVLSHAKDHGYLHKIVIANDASTDRSTEILLDWEKNHGLTVVHLPVNANKEGAILAAMEKLAADNNLKPFTVLMDADTRIQLGSSGGSVAGQLISAINFMLEKHLAAVALRVSASYFKRPSIFWMSAYSTYFGLHFDGMLLSLEKRLWVINGAGGIFHSNQLLNILRGMVPNFETGDLLITVALMKAGGKIALYKDIISLTYVPATIKELFNQRRRWERGTIKVLIQESRFYFGLFAPPTMLSVALALHMVLYVGLGIVIASMFFPGMLSMDGSNAVLTKASIITSYYVWFCIDVSKAAWVAYRTAPKRFPLFLLCAVANAPVWIFIVTPARLFGGIEAVFDLAKERIGWRKLISP